ncbi:YceI family protein [Streptomyces sp. HC44]|uniref:YceI family protein n=1 Tax=Streptomyces scabichelini TaxID=2711217 RepID=A0A6G4UYD2_9ACTN|nr:YceI family protein [Streptomyces scabichelini]NGO06736.1 YceI family protein [Streptomyces scabichelini]
MTTTTDLGELTGDYTLDSARTRIGFVSRAAMVTKVRGQFDDFEGSARLDGDDPSKSVARLMIRVRSIQTRNQKRDDHLCGGDFLDMDNHPVISFTSTRVEQVDGTNFKVTGDLTVRGMTKPVTVDFRLTGAENDPRGGLRLGFKGKGTLNRKDWGVSWGGALVSEKVTLDFDIAVLRQP